MTKINYQALREAAERAIPAMERLLMLPVDDDLISEQELKDYGVDIDALNAFKFLAGPETVLALLDERERNQQYIKRRDQENEDIALTVGKLRVELEAAEKTSAARLEALDRTHKMFQREQCRAEAAEKRIAELEKSEEQLINERDHAESALADMYFAATGDRPEWSNWFGFSDAVDAVVDRIADLEAKQPSPVVPEEKPMPNPLSMYAVDAVAAIAEVRGWNACRAAMLQSGNFRENKNSSTNNFREIAETSTNYPVIPSEVLSAIQKVAKIRADFDDFDGDRRGIGDCLDEAEQELIVTINKYASQLAAEPIAPNDVREQTAIPQVPVTPDGWISCSERMPEDNKMLLAFSQGEIVAAYWNWVVNPIDYKKYRAFTYLSGNILDDVTHWMPLPEPPKGAK
ncbi:ead/Ea22-like family protein [Escherichia coli]|nr:ead/Ea22-like family protein [Escherichia coli]